ncbi:MAG: sensor domain-containing phosphodiesterase [Saccharospirillum sp.]
MDSHQTFIDYHASLMQLSHRKAFTNDSRQGKLVALAELGCRLLNVQRFSVWQLNMDASAIDCELLYRQIDGVDPNPMRLERTDNPKYFEALLEARVIDAHQARTDERTKTFSEFYLQPNGIQAMLDAPVFNNGRLSGVICLESTQSRHWSLPEISFVAAIADTISLTNTYEAWLYSQEQINYLSHFDDLTGLPNLRAVQKRLSHLLDTAGPPAEPCALLWIDLDRLKAINDGMGQLAGNRIINEIARRLRELFIPGKDKIARVGGDEFILLIRHRLDRSSLSHLCSTVQETINQPVQLTDQKASLTASIGVARYPEDAQSGSALLRCAETAMYHAKETGRASHQFFNSDLEINARQRFQMEAQLRNAINRNQLSVFYQPIMDARSKQVVGVEALVRWQHPQRGWLTPIEFLPLAQISGLMVSLGDAVFRCVCLDIQSARRSGQPLPLVSINLAPEQLHDRHLPERLARTLAEFDIQGADLEFEIIEDALKDHTQSLQQTLQGLIELGSRLSIDDFGTGYSSLARLKHLPFSKLKIDRAFVKDLVNNQDDRAIVRSIIGMAEGLGLSVVAEGVETEAQQDWLLEQGCEFLQGYLYSKAMPLASLRTFLTSAA